MNGGVSEETVLRKERSVERERTRDGFVCRTREDCWMKKKKANTADSTSLKYTSPPRSRPSTHLIV
jgi:hypothetical protein